MMDVASILKDLGKNISELKQASEDMINDNIDNIPEDKRAYYISAINEAKSGKMTDKDISNFLKQARKDASKGNTSK